MESNTRKRRMPIWLAILLMILIAVAGGIALYESNIQKQKLLAQAEQVRLDQENHTNAVYAQIETNLASIREHESLISKDFTGPDNNNSNMLPEERIQNEINYIKQLIDDNNKLIESLHQEISRKDSRIAGYRSSIKDLQAKIEGFQQKLNQILAEKDALQQDLDKTTIANNNLSDQVNQLGGQISSLDSVINDQNNRLVNKDKALYTAYYKVGTFKDLRDQDMLQKEGGFLGINRVTTLVGVPDTALFHSIDMRDVTRIPVHAKRWDIVTGQDPSTYKYSYDNNGMVEWLTITDPAKFWAKSKYLVIVVRDNDYDELALYR